MWGWYLATVVAGLLAFRWVQRVNPKDIKDLVAFPVQVVAFCAVILFFAFGVPQIFMRTPRLMQRGWQQPISMVEPSYNEAKESISGSLYDPALDGGDGEFRFDYGETGYGDIQNPQANQSGGVIQPPSGGEYVATETHLVQRGETLSGLAQKYGVTVTELRSWNNMMPGDILLEGADLIVAAEVKTDQTGTPEAAVSVESSDDGTPSPPISTPIPQPTATPDLRPYYEDLAELRDAGNTADCPPECRREQAARIIETVLEINPNDSVARQAGQQLAASQLILNELRKLGDRDEGGAYVYGQDHHSQVVDILSGFDYVVSSVQRDLLGGSKWDQTAWIRVATRGWIFGEEIELSVGHVNRLGGSDSGDRFTVYGQ